jgi:hypothetical protein
MIAPDSSVKDDIAANNRFIFACYFAIKIYSIQKISLQ